MSPYYALLADLRGRDALVVGGGKVAEQKIRGLMGTGARLTSVAERPSPRLRSWAKRKKLRLLARRFVGGDLRGQSLVFCATDDESLNRKVGNECRRRGIWVNVADRPALCSFIVPAVVRRGTVLLAASTQGASPYLAKFLRQELERRFGRGVGRLAGLLGGRRRALLALAPEARRRLLARIVTRRTIADLERGKIPAVNQRLREGLERARA